MDLYLVTNSCATVKGECLGNNRQPPLQNVNRRRKQPRTCEMCDAMYSFRIF